MRFTPLFKEDHEFQTSKTFSEKIYNYVYEKNVKGFRDEKTPFIDDKGHQLEIIYRIVNEVYEERFGSFYSQPAFAIYQNMCRNVLLGKVFSLAQIIGPEREAKVNSFTAILNRLGACVRDDQFDYSLVDSIQNASNSNAKTVNWLLFKYFGYKTK